MTIDELTAAIAAKTNLEDSVDYLVADLARRIKATSNDQNIQKLAGELASHRPAIVAAIVQKSALPAAE